jgi:hypothetical protein
MASMMLRHPYRTPNEVSSHAPVDSGAHGCFVCALRRALASVPLASVVLAGIVASSLCVTTAGALLAVHSMRLASQTLALATAVLDEPRHPAAKKPLAQAVTATASPRPPEEPTAPTRAAPRPIETPPFQLTRHGGVKEMDVDRFIVEAVINEQVSRLSRARFEAPRAEGELLGGRLSGVTQGSLLSSLGFEEGDTVWGVNGFYVATPEQALEAYARLGRADVVEVWFTRKGQMHVQRYNIR